MVFRNNARDLWFSSLSQCLEILLFNHFHVFKDLTRGHQISQGIRGYEDTVVIRRISSLGFKYHLYHFLAVSLSFIQPTNEYLRQNIIEINSVDLGLHLTWEWIPVLLPADSVSLIRWLNSLNLTLHICPMGMISLFNSIDCYEN